MIGIGGLLAVVAGRWARTHTDTTPRYTAGYGSGFSPSSRHFWGGVVVAFGVLLVLSSALGVPADLMH